MKVMLLILHLAIHHLPDITASICEYLKRRKLRQIQLELFELERKRESRSRLLNRFTSAGAENVRQAFLLGCRRLLADLYERGLRLNGYASGRAGRKDSAILRFVAAAALVDVLREINALEELEERLSAACCDDCCSELTAECRAYVDEIESSIAACERGLMC